jgi:hypothetical protein
MLQHPVSGTAKLLDHPLYVRRCLSPWRSKFFSASMQHAPDTA